MSGLALMDCRIAETLPPLVVLLADSRRGGAGPMGSESGVAVSSCISEADSRVKLSVLGVLGACLGLLPSLLWSCRLGRVNTSDLPRSGLSDR